MGSWAEKMIIIEVQEESRIKEKKIALQNKITQDKKHEVNISAMLLSLDININNEWFWKLIAYGYFACKTLGLLILVDVFIFKRPTIMLFALIFMCFFYFNSKLYKLYLRRKD